MAKEIKSVNVISLGKILATIGLLWGILIGLGVIAFGSRMGFPMGGAAIIVFPVTYAIVGFVCGVVNGVVYNFAAEKIGGIKLEFK